MKVELRYAPLPVIGWIAVHYWFVVYDDAGTCHRWEVWQTPDAGGPGAGPSFGHLHCDLKPPEADVGGGPTRLAASWDGPAAERIARVLANPRAYPWQRLYRYWPGPNSNSFVAWVLGQAGIRYPLHWRGIGQKWARKRK